MKKNRNAKDIYQIITDRIIEQLANGHRPWTSPWSQRPISLPVRVNGETYQGINIVALWEAASRKGYESPRWLTFKQAQKEGGRVRQGEKATKVVYWNTFTKQDADSDEDKPVKIPFIRSYAVFNIEQIDGIEEPEAVALFQNTEARLAKIDAFFQATGAVIKHGGGRAYYRPSEDTITMPHFERFTDAESYYSTLAHETVHWVGHSSRLDRGTGSFAMSSPEYAREELVAELGAAFLSAHLGLRADPREDHAAYLHSWLQVLKQDNRAIFKAATEAQKAVAFILAKAGKVLEA